MMAGMYGAGLDRSNQPMTPRRTDTFRPTHGSLKGRRRWQHGRQRPGTSRREDDLRPLGRERHRGRDLGGRDQLEGLHHAQGHRDGELGRRRERLRVGERPR